MKEYENYIKNNEEAFMDKEYYSYDGELQIGEEYVPCSVVETSNRAFKGKKKYKNLIAYEIRHSDDDSTKPATIERKVKVNFRGYVFFSNNDKIDLINRTIEENGYIDFSDVIEEERFY